MAQTRDEILARDPKVLHHPEERDLMTYVNKDDPFKDENIWLSFPSCAAKWWNISFHAKDFDPEVWMVRAFERFQPCSVVFFVQNEKYSSGRDLAAYIEKADIGQITGFRTEPNPVHPHSGGVDAYMFAPNFLKWARWAKDRSLVHKGMRVQPTNWNNQQTDVGGYGQDYRRFAKLSNHTDKECDEYDL